MAGLKSGSATDFVLSILQGEPFLLSLIVAIAVGTGLGFLVVWMVTRHTRRMAENNAVQLMAVARREEAVAAQVPNGCPSGGSVEVIGIGIAASKKAQDKIGDQRYP